MSHFAEVVDGYVVRVIVAEQDFIDSGVVGNPANWVQTSYNTSGNKHALGGTPLRKNYAAVNFMYDSVRDAFIPPKPYASWILDEETCLWVPPIPYPDDIHDYSWDELNRAWVLVPE